MDKHDWHMEMLDPQHHSWKVGKHALQPGKGHYRTVAWGAGYLAAVVVVAIVFAAGLKALLVGF